MVITEFYCLRLFASLAGDKSPSVPYNREMADQRRKYGDSVLRRCDEHLTAQKQFEAEAKARLDAARQRRQEEKERLEALEVRFTIDLIYLQSASLTPFFFWCYSVSASKNTTNKLESSLKNVVAHEKQRLNGRGR